VREVTEIVKKDDIVDERDEIADEEGEIVEAKANPQLPRAGLP
jgi:hypothetical protein